MTSFDGHGGMREAEEGSKCQENDTQVAQFNDSSDDDDDDDPYSHLFESVRSKTGLEIGIHVTWPNVPPFQLSTCLSADSIAPFFHGTQWAGTRIWRASIVALEYLLSDQCPVQLNHSTTVLELGCGLGVPGMILHALKGCDVVLTDMAPLVEQLRANLSACPFAQNSSIQALPLDWSADGVRDLIQSTGKTNGFDVVLNCDCIFEPLYGESWKKLLECQEALLEANPNSYMLISVERRRFDGIEKYLDALNASTVVDRVELVQPEPESPSEIQLYRIYGRTA